MGRFESDQAVPFYLQGYLTSNQAELEHVSSFIPWLFQDQSIFSIGMDFYFFAMYTANTGHTYHPCPWSLLNLPRTTGTFHSLSGSQCLLENSHTIAPSAEKFLLRRYQPRFLVYHNIETQRRKVQKMCELLGRSAGS